jgi:hypothetical protein
MSSLIDSDLDLDLLARDTISGEFGDFGLSPTPTPVGKVKLRGGDDSSMGMIMISVVLGAVAAIILLYVVRQHTTLPEQLAALMTRKPTSLKKTPPSSLQKTSSPQRTSSSSPKARPSPSKPVQLLKKAAPPTKTRKSPVGAKKGVQLSSMPQPLKQNSRVKLGDIKGMQNSLGIAQEALPAPRLPTVPRANNLEGSSKVMEANRSLIEAAQTGDLRKKLSRATWGLTPVSDRKEEMPFHTSKTFHLSAEREKILADQWTKNTSKILGSGAVPILFDLPQDFNLPERSRTVHDGQNSVGLGLSIEPRAKM